MEIEIRDGIEKMDFKKVTQMLAESFWSPGIKIDEVIKGASNSALVVGVFFNGQSQIGYARVISDKTRFAYIMDVYIDENFRKRGIGQKLMRYILCHNELRDVYQWTLVSAANELYEKLGFEELTCPTKWMEIRNERPER